MKTRNFFILCLTAGLIFTSCKKDDDETDTGKDPFEAEYSDLSVAENKANLEKTGMGMINEIRDLEKSEAMDVMANMVNLAGSDFLMGSSSVFMGPMNKTLKMKGENIEPAQVFNELKSISEEPNSFSELWAAVVGKYSWNATTKTWDSTGMSNAVIFEFPGKEGDATNTASITINNFGAQIFTNPVLGFEDEGMKPELPTSLNVSLKYNTTVLASYEFRASYKDDAMPTSLSTALTIGEFSWSVELAHSPYSEASVKESFKHSDKVIVEAYVDGKGDWSQSNIEANTEEHKDFIYYDQYYQDSVFNTWTEVMIENIVKNGNAYIQLMNVKIAGMIDVNSFVTKMKQIDEQYPDPWETGDDEAYAKAQAEALNSNATLVLVYIDNNQKIAKVEAYAYLESEEDGWDVGIRFVFADGSYASSESYFSSEFEKDFADLIAEFNKLEDELNQKY